MALKIGSVNTIVHRDGKLKGYNTDGIGFFRSLPPAFSIKGKTMVLLGAGGAALAIIAQAIHLGVKRILVFVREERLLHYRSKVQLLEDAFDFLIELQRYRKELFYGKREAKSPMEALLTEKDVQSSFNQADLILNATGVGMDSESLPIPSHLTFPPQALIVEMAYYPAVTPFLQLAVNQGNQRVNGLGMLFYQAEAAFELMTGKVFPTESVWEALTTEYRQFVCD